jgi:transcriptional regulator with PAS, ATPase and Fis domain
VFFADANYKIRGKMAQPGYIHKNPFFKVQAQLKFGFEYLNQDLEKATTTLMAKAESNLVYESWFKGVQGVAARVSVSGEYMGTVLAYPFMMDDTTSAETDELKKQFLEAGANEKDAVAAIESLKKISPEALVYLRELVDLVAEEIVTFYEEIEKRDERILQLSTEVGNKYRYHSMIGKSKKMQQIYHLLERISNSESTILIEGENGTGKELVAKAIHYSSPRKDNVFVAQNCSAFNDNLLDSELFGHVKGSFTGAIKDKKGLFEVANGGTLFLDEIGDTSLAMQVKLLRVLQEGTFLPVGSTTPKKVNVRVVCATNRKLGEMIAAATFREDLYYRINVINVHLPPLRERKEDISLLVDAFIEKRCAETGYPAKSVSPKTMQKFLDYPWPGNVRELENEIERLVVLAGTDKVIVPEMLSARILEHGRETNSGVRAGLNMKGSLKDAVEELEIIMIRDGLKRCGFNKSQVAKELGISRANLIMKVEKFDLDKRKKAVNE